MTEAAASRAIESEPAQPRLAAPASRRAARLALQLGSLAVYPEIVVGMLSIGVFGMLSSLLVKRLGLALMPWYTLDEQRSR